MHTWFMVVPYNLTVGNSLSWIDPVATPHVGDSVAVVHSSWLRGPKRIDRGRRILFWNYHRMSSAGEELPDVRAAPSRKAATVYIS